MGGPSQSGLVEGRRIRFTWTEGPTRGKTHEHHFHADGTVDWHAVDDGSGAAGIGAPAAPAPERPRYFEARLADQICLVSYRSRTGFTLSVALDLAAQTIVGIASNDAQWLPVRGRLDVMG
jgi:hypothetical protein